MFGISVNLLMNGVTPIIIKKLHEVFGHFDSQDSWKALFATNELFRELAIQVALKLSYHYPKEIDEAVSNCILNI